MIERTCEECGKVYEARTSQQVVCSKECRAKRERERRSRKPETKTCDICQATFSPYSGVQRYCSRACGNEAERRKKSGMSVSADTGLTRRCRNKLCIERFIPTNPNHWWHETACRDSEHQWDVEDILAEEGALTLGASHLELAKSAFGQKNRALRENSRLRSLRDYLTFEIQSFHDEHPEYRYPEVPKPPKDTGKKRPREIIVQLSDWQIGKWEQGFGVEATRQRIEEMKRALAEIVKRQRDAGYPVQRIRLSFGGDGIEGCYIYRGQNVTGLDKTGNTHRLNVQIRVYAHEIAGFVTFALTLVDEVEVETVGGNHGRPNGPNDYADPEDNFDVMAAWWAQDIMRDNPRVRWNTSDDWWHGFESMGHYIVSLHGDQWNGPFARLETLLPQWIASGVFGQKPAMVLTHHRHTRQETEIAGIPVIQNGTIDGGSRWYLKAYGRASRPAQNIIVMSEKYAPESIWPVYFSNAVSGALVA